MIQDHHVTYATIYYNSFTPCYRRIARTFLAFEKKRRNGDYEAVYPSRAKIAECSKCSEETVKDFISKYKDWLFKIEHRKKADGKHTSNKYTIDETFFEFMLLMEGCGYLSDPLKYKETILQGVAEQPFFLVQKWWQIHHLSTTNLPAVSTRKLPTIGLFLSEVLRYDCLSRKDQPKKASEEIRKIKERKGFGVLADFGFTFSQKEKLTWEFSPEVLKKAKEKMMPYISMGKVKNQRGYFVKCAYDLAKKKAYGGFSA